MRIARCRGCKQTQPLDEEAGLCFRCLRQAQKEEKAQREAARRAEKAPVAQTFRPVPQPEPPAPVVPRAPGEWDRHPLLGPSWEAAQEFLSATSTARHDLLLRVRALLKRPGATARDLETLRQELDGKQSPVPAAAAQALRHALRAGAGDLSRVGDLLQALVGYADYRQTLRRTVPEVTLSPAAGEVTADWYLEGAWALASELARLDVGPVRQVLEYLRRAAREPNPEVRAWRTALLLPLEAGSAARAMKVSRADEGARVRLLELTRWSVEAALAAPDGLERIVLPAVQAVVAFHGYERERQRNAEAPAVTAPDGYLEGGYFADGAPRARLFREDAVCFAHQFGTDQVTSGQIRRFFNELRRLETLSGTLPWPEVRSRLLSLVPLAADAGARGLKERRDFRALGLLVTANLRLLAALPEAEQPHAFRKGLVPHFEAVLAYFNAQALGVPPVAPAAAGEVLARDEQSLDLAERLGFNEASNSLVRGIYSHFRGLEHLDGRALGAEVERAIALSEDVLRRSPARPETLEALRTLTRQARGLTGAEYRGRYLPLFQNTLAWFVGLDGLRKLDDDGAPRRPRGGSER
jgi:hypothetical protein